MDNKAKFLQDVKAETKLHGREVGLTLEPKSALRSKKANAYYWSCVVALAAKESGQPEDDIHAFWCEQFLPNEKKRLLFFNRLTGERLQVDIDGRRTSRLTGTSFYDFVENCRLWCMEYLNVTTPDPDPDYWRKRSKKSVAA
jgi:hypothetical protein